MNFQDFLLKVLDTANFPQNKRQKFIDIFYEYYYARLIDEFAGIDPSYAQRLTTAVDVLKTDPDQFKRLWADLRANTEFSQVINEVTDEVIGYLLSDIAKSTTAEQQVQIRQAAGL